MLWRALRRRLSPSLVVSLLALFVALGGTTYAATGGNFILGQSNTASSQTGLTANSTGKALNVTQQSTGTGATALGLNVPAGKPPFTVNSGTKVANLNADKLDGKDSTQLSPAAAGVRTADTNVNPFGVVSVVSVNITTAGTSVLLASGALEIENRDTTAADPNHGFDQPSCFVRVDGTSDGVPFSTGIPDTYQQDATSLAVLGAQGVGAGTHTVELMCTTNSGAVVVDTAALNVSAHPLSVN